jgi:hypothetical protein
MENIEWNPPVLEISIERHGGTFLSSSRADIQRWFFNPSTKKVDFFIAGYRQVEQRSAPLKVKPIAEEISQLILNQKEGD